MNKKLIATATLLLALSWTLASCSRMSKEEELSRKLTDTQRQVDKWQKQSSTDGKNLNDWCVSALKKKMDLNRLGIFACVDDVPASPAPSSNQAPAKKE